jgi:hypothetical protein
MKFKYNKRILQSLFSSEFEEIGDTDLGHIDILEFIERISKGDKTSILSQSLATSGLVEATSFPISVQSVDLVL